MPNTQGFEIVSELTQATLLNLLRAAWKSADDDSGEGVIPEETEIPAGTALGPYAVRAGTVLIPQGGLGLEMNVPLDGIDILMQDVTIQVEIDNPPIESATFFDLTADLRIPTPVQAIDETNVYAVFEDLAADAVGVSLTSGDPIGPITQAAVEEYVHGRFADPAFPRIIDNVPINFPPYSMQGRLELFDDETDPAKRITVDFPAGNVVELFIPCYIRLYEITGEFAGISLASPMGTNGTIRVTADYVEEAERVVARLATADVVLENLTAADDPTEANNYQNNKSLIAFGGFDLDALIISGFNTVATNHIRTQIGDIEVDVPSLATIESFISQQIRAELVNRRRIFIWRPDPPEDSDVTVEDVTVAALPDALALALNRGGGANADALTNFIPANRDFAVALSAGRVLEALEDVKCETYSSLCGANPSPHTLDEKIEGKTVKIRKLNFSLRSGSIHISGEITVVDALLGCIDVDASFDADAGLRWIDNPDGTQSIEPFLIGDPDTDLPWYAWLLSILTGLLTFGVIGAIIGAVIVAVVENVAEKIGARVARDEVSDQLKVLSAWPQNLDNIGEIEARFLNDIGIDESGILFAGSMLITSQYALTLTDFARSNGPYTFAAAQVIQFNGGASKPNAAPRWDFDDGNIATTRNPSHRYGKSGLYIAKHRIEVTEDGGVTTNHFAKVDLANTAPQVTLPPDISIKEGETFTIIGRFTDENWLDRHTVTIDFGDNTAPQDLEVTETNEEPRAEGEVCAEHAYCDNGNYTIRLTVRDDVGGIGTATMQATVENVAPTLEIDPRINSLVDQPIRLQATFTDPGWCDTHRGLWDLGDCTPPRDAIIRQEHEPPQGEGTAEVLHYFRKCGRFETRLVLTDDDGGSDEAVQIVNANRLENPDFEAGFYLVPEVGDNELQVANHWRPYYHHLQSRTPRQETGKGIIMRGREIELSNGRRAQMVETQGAVGAGVMQVVQVNRGWDYEFTAQLHLPHEVSSARMRIGIDPLGRLNPTAMGIDWIEAESGGAWRNLSVRTTAKSGKLTVLLGIEEWTYGRNIIFFDEARLYQIQPFRNELPPEEEPNSCLEFSEFQVGTVFNEPFTYRGFRVAARSGTLEIVDRDAPPAVKKLAFNAKGVEVTLPDYADAISVTVNNYGGRTLRITLLLDGEPIAQRTEIIRNEVRTFTYADAGSMNAIRIEGGDNEAALIEVCILRPRLDRPPVPQ